MIKVELVFLVLHLFIKPNSSWTKIVITAVKNRQLG